MSVYLKRYAFKSLEIADTPQPNTGLIVVIPVFNEPDVLPALESLSKSDLPDVHTEVLIVINESEASDETIVQQNDLTARLIGKWIEKNTVNGISFHVARTTLPKKNAGVGLARKAGMDEAIRRFESIGNERGILLCFDADCTCSTSYLKSIYQEFKEKDLYGASINYEHETNGLNEIEREGIFQYELHLRYYVNALRSAGYPYAFHTVGSSMAVRADIYKKAGGMNKRKAGEDFHFLHKVIPYGNYSEIMSATVYPAARVSDRVPFGTGKAMNEWLSSDHKDIVSYHPDIFTYLKSLLQQIPKHYANNSIESDINTLPQVVRNYLHQESYAEIIQEINRQSSNPKTFLHRWFLWFNGLKALHFVHYLRDHEYPSIPVKEAASQLIEKEYACTLEELIRQYRNLDENFKADQISLKRLYSGFL